MKAARPFEFILSLCCAWTIGAATPAAAEPERLRSPTLGVAVIQDGRVLPIELDQSEHPPLAVVRLKREPFRFSVPKTALAPLKDAASPRQILFSATQSFRYEKRDIAGRPWIDGDFAPEALFWPASAMAHTSTPTGEIFLSEGVRKQAYHLYRKPALLDEGESFGVPVNHLRDGDRQDVLPNAKEIHVLIADPGQVFDDRSAILPAGAYQHFLLLFETADIS